MKETTVRLRKSVTPLETLYAVVMGFTLTAGLKTFADPWVGGTAAADIRLRGPDAFLLYALILTLVPFFHGAMRHLEELHRRPETNSQHKIVFAEYIMLFLEGAVFVLLGLCIGSPQHFVFFFLCLLAIDSPWAALSWWWTPSEHRRHLALWLLLNVVTILALLILKLRVPLPADWPTFVVWGALVRTVADYTFNWPFYLRGSDSSAQSVAVRRLVSIESPYKGDMDKNREFARNVCRYAVNAGYNPYAMHIFFTQFLEDGSPEERATGIECGLAWGALADEVWFCLRQGESLSEGMLLGETAIRNDPDRPVIRYFHFTQAGELEGEYPSQQKLLAS